MADSLRSAVVIGAGYIGMEMTDALLQRRIHVTVVEYLPQVMPTLAPSLGSLVERALVDRGMKVVTDTAVSTIERPGTRLVVSGAGGFETAADMVVYATGVKPSTTLAESAGIERGAGGDGRPERVCSR